MTLLIVSFLAGVLTIAAPCILPLLPIVIGGSIVDGQRLKSTTRAIIISLSLAISVIVFTLLLKFSTSLIGVKPIVWQLLSGGLVIALGLNFVQPQIWEFISARLKLGSNSNRLLSQASRQQGTLGAGLTGLALGPVFSSCSPTYSLIVATVLPASFSRGLAYLVAYALGLGLTLLMIAFLGQTLVTKLRWLANPHSTFKKIIGLLFIVVGLAVISGLDKRAQAFILEKGWYTPVSSLEKKLRD